MRFLEGPPTKFTSAIAEKLTRDSKDSERTRDELITAFTLKAISEVENDGFTAHRQMNGKDSFSHEVLSGTVILSEGNKKYKISLVSRINRPGGSDGLADMLVMSISSEDVLDLSGVSSGRKRRVEIKKETDFSTTENQGVRTSFYQTVKKEKNPSPMPHLDDTSLPINDSIAFLQELLSAQVDTEATTQAFEDLQKDKHEFMSYWKPSDLYWNRERPGSVQALFPSISSDLPVAV